jgi:hypothetical protein
MAPKLPSQMLNMPGSLIIDPVKDYPTVANILRGCDYCESYVVSPGILCAYGRFGLWSYIDQGTTCFAYIDPDKPLTLNVLPQFGNQQICIAHELSKIVPEHYNIEVIRVSDNYLALITHQLNFTGENFKIIPEDIRDYVFPVRIYDCHSLAAHKGDAYKTVRYNLNRFHKLGQTSIEPYIDAKHAADLRSLFLRWIVMHISEKSVNDNTIALFDSVIYLTLSSATPIQALVANLDNKPSGAIFWEISASNKSMANVIATFIDPYVPGVNYYLLTQLAHHLSSLGVKQMNLGGSEYAGLDQFKSQLRPSNSVALQTISIIRDHK